MEGCKRSEITKGGRTARVEKEEDKQEGIGESNKRKNKQGWKDERKKWSKGKES